MVRVISLFSLLNNDYSLENGKFCIIPYSYEGRFSYANGGSYMFPIVFVRESPNNERGRDTGYNKVIYFWR